MTEPDWPAPVRPGRVDRTAGLFLVLLLTVLLALWGAFLVPFRIGATLVPVSWVIALVGNAVLGRAAGSLVGKPGIALAGGVWLAIGFLLGSRRSEGDLVVPGSTEGLVFLLLGAVGSAVAYGMHVTRPRD